MFLTLLQQQGADRFLSGTAAGTCTGEGVLITSGTAVVVVSDVGTGSGGWVPGRSKAKPGDYKKRDALVAKIGKDAPRSRSFVSTAKEPPAPAKPPSPDIETIKPDAAPKPDAVVPLTSTQVERLKESLKDDLTPEMAIQLMAEMDAQAALVVGNQIDEIANDLLAVVELMDAELEEA